MPRKGETLMFYFQLRYRAERVYKEGQDLLLSKAYMPLGRKMSFIY